MDKEESNRKKKMYFRQEGSHMLNAKAGSLILGRSYRGLWRESHKKQKSVVMATL